MEIIYMKGNGHPTNNQNISEYVALLYQKYSHKLYCNAFHYTSNPSIAEDGVQQIFEKILLHPDTALHVPEHEIIYYLFAIQRNVMYTLNFYGFKYSEIACMFHISERAVKKRIAVAKKRVRTMFQKEDFL